MRWNGAQFPFPSLVSAGRTGGITGMNSKSVFPGMKITKDVRKYVAEQGIAEEGVLKKGMEEKSREFVDLSCLGSSEKDFAQRMAASRFCGPRRATKGAEVYAKV